MEESYAFSLRMDNYKFIQASKSKAYSWIHFLKSIQSGISEEPQLYNLKKDPKEFKNLATKNKKQLKIMQSELNRILESDRTR